MEFFHHKTKYPFMATRRRWYLVSAILIVAALTSFAVRGLNLGIDFTGGVVLELEFAQDANLEKIRTSLEDAGFAHAAVQSFGTSRDVMVRLLPQEGEDTNQVAQNVLSAIQAQDPSVELRRTEVVGPQVGEELAKAYAQADVFVFPSLTDTFGNTILEALASGAPVAAYPVTGPLDIIGEDSEVGALDSDLKTACLAALSASREKARELALQYSWEAATTQFINNIRAANGVITPKWKKAWQFAAKSLPRTKKPGDAAGPVSSGT